MGLGYTGKEKRNSLRIFPMSTNRRWLTELIELCEEQGYIVTNEIFKKENPTCRGN